MDQKTSAPSLFLRRIAGGIVTARWVILILTLAAMVFCAFSSFWVQVDSSLASFLAEDAEARRGIRLMAQEFQTYATAEVMVEDLSMAGAENVRQMIADVDGVAMVRYNASKNFRDDAALYSVTFRSLDHDEQLDALNRVKDALSGYSTGGDSRSAAHVPGRGHRAAGHELPARQDLVYLQLRHDDPAAGAESGLRDHLLQPL